MYVPEGVLDNDNICGTTDDVKISGILDDVPRSLNDGIHNTLSSIGITEGDIEVAKFSLLYMKR